MILRHASAMIGFACLSLLLGSMLKREMPLKPVEAKAALAQPQGPDLYRATVLRVIDGDTLEAKVSVWINQELVTRVRLRSIDAAEIHGHCDEERRLAEAAKKRLADLAEGRNVILAHVGPDKYFGRVVADVMIEGRSAGDILMAEGLARAMAGKRRETWC